jgi:UDP-N-acetylglucosamine 4,6-dehydratase/5-epimerase
MKKKTKDISSEFRGKDILVTGGCGSIGSELVEQLIKFKPSRIRVFDNNESGLFNLKQKLNSSLIRILVGDIRDKERLRFAIKGCDIVFHAAALKHVPLCEYNPFEAVSTNVLGTQNLVEVAREENVSKLVAISTDKAVNPINTMGATKLLSEKIVLNGAIGDGCSTKFSCVRFGNVLNSVGSVIPIFRKQIEEGGPVTITSSEMVRYFMTIHQAVFLILKSASISKGKEIFILKMNKLKIIDLASVMISELGPKYGFTKGQIKTKLIGVRSGEKIDEGLVTLEEKERIIDLNDLMIVLPQNTKSKMISKNFSLSKDKLLTKDEIKDILFSIDVL